MTSLFLWGIYHSNQFSRTSLYTTLTMWFGWIASGGLNIFRPFELVALETTTYNCPWAKNSSVIFAPTILSVCPWALLEVMLKQARTGNWYRSISNGTWVSSGWNRILGISKIFPLLVSPMPRAWMILEEKSMTTYRAPFTWPLLWSKLVKSMMGLPLFNTIRWSGIPDKVTWKIKVKVSYSNSFVNNKKKHRILYLVQVFCWKVDFWGFVDYFVSLTCPWGKLKW